MESINKTLVYHELLMVCDDLNKTEYALPEGYRFAFYSGENDIDEWINIHIQSGEFASKRRARKYFYDFYGDFLDKLSERLFFVVHNSSNKKVATATLSPTDEYGYKCVIDWFAIKKSYQGKKLSKPMLSKIFSLAKSLGYDKILLHTQTHTFVAAKLYLDFGFEIFNATSEHMGYRILSSLISHPKLDGFSPCPVSEMYDSEVCAIVKRLDTLFTTYTYEVWNSCGRNDVYVLENGKEHYYKFYEGGNKLIEQEGECE